MKKIACLILFAALLAACASTPNVSIVTNGFHVRLPPAGTTVQFTDIEGQTVHFNRWPYSRTVDQTARQTVTVWLVKHGLIQIAPQEARYSLHEEQHFRLQNDADRLHLGRMPGAGLRVAIDIAYKDERYEGSTIMVQATEVETGLVVWSGSARSVISYPRRFNWKVLCLICVPPDDRYFVTDPKPTHDITNLVACQALETAWGLREPGTYPVETLRCE